MRRSVLTLCLLALFSYPDFAHAQADDTPLERLTKFDELNGWQAVGRVNIAGGGFCTGVLIETDLVLTAAHCLVHRRTGKPLDPARITFRAGLRDGVSIADRKAMHTAIHKDYDINDRNGTRQIATDVGLMRLTSPISNIEAAPFNVASRGVGREVSVVSYARERPNALSWQRRCGVLDRDEKIASFSCDVHFGSSGAPVFDMSGNRAEIVSIISSGVRQGRTSISWGPRIAQPIAELKEALRTGRGVTQAGGGKVSTVPVTRGARFVKPGDRGNLFKKP